MKPKGRIIVSVFLLALVQMRFLSAAEEAAEERPLNRLKDATSPYLRAHADNPVDWYEWGPDAFAVAKEEGKPIFLSIGYSSCHWCHVMERESFMDERIADLINRLYVPVKVDREERPDVDHTYMTAYQAMTGDSGGWPLNMFLTPELEPFYGATYLPPRARDGLPSFPAVLFRTADGYESAPDQAGEMGRQIHAHIESVLKEEARPKSVNLEKGLELMDRAANSLAEIYDKEHGGFGQAPKFPQAEMLRLLLWQWHRNGDPFYKKCVLETLRAMRRGGIYDQLGGGFHRYAVDAAWRVPHFEKMLCDNALLIPVYLEAFQITGEDEFLLTAREVADFVLRELTDEGGGFMSSISAESDGAEGSYYTWTTDEVREVLGREEYREVAAWFDLEAEGNFLDGSGRNTLYLEREAKPHQAPVPVIDAMSRLREARDARPRPEVDDKVISAWNGLMISALAKLSQITGDAKYREASVQAGEFVLTNLWVNEQGLSRSWREGKTSGAGVLDDYALMVLACLDLYEATFDFRWLKFGNLLAREMVKRFWDSERGIFYLSDEAVKDLPTRPFELRGGALPSGHSAAAEALWRLGHYLARDEYQEISREAIKTSCDLFWQGPQAVPRALRTLYQMNASPPELVVAGAAADRDVETLLTEIYRIFLPGRYLDWVDDEEGEAVFQAGPLADGQTALAIGKKAGEVGELRLFVCRDYVCKQPVDGLEQAIDVVSALTRESSSVND